MDNRYNLNGWRVPCSNSPDFNYSVKDEIYDTIAPVLFGDARAAYQIVAKFEEEFSESMGYKYISAVQSGSAALRLSFLACGVKPGDEIITVANSDMANTCAISQCGAQIVLCDVLETDHTMDPDCIEALITDKTVGICPVDMYGHPANIKRIREIADRHNLFIVQDATLSPGSRDHGQKMGAFADVTIFSTSPLKLIQSVGAGGIVVTDNKEIHEKVNLLRGNGIPNREYPMTHDYVAEGYNLKMAPIDAAVVSLKMAYFFDWNEKRKQVGRWYAEKLANIKGIDMPSFRPESEPVFWEYVICIKDRDAAYDHLRESGVNVCFHYIPAAHKRKVYIDRKLPGSDHLPTTEKLAEELICLPVDPFFTEDDIDYINSVLLSFVNQTDLYCC